MSGSSSIGSVSGAALLLTPPSAVVLEPTEDGLTDAGALLRAGAVVAFPTETVYGLGANAFLPDAVNNIFRYKGRPMSDPLIVHVLSVEQALEVVVVDDVGEALFRVLAAAFWPGPLTIVARARECIPSSITAGTGFVGTRSPLGPIARAVIDKVRNWPPAFSLPGTVRSTPDAAVQRRALSAPRACACLRSTMHGGCLGRALLWGGCDRCLIGRVCAGWRAHRRTQCEPVLSRQPHDSDARAGRLRRLARVRRQR